MVVLVAMSTPRARIRFATVGGSGTDSTEHPQTAKQHPREEPAQAEETLTLRTKCVCGHTRKCHRGLHMEVCGACLECGCEQFTWARETPDSNDPDEQTTAQIRAALDQVKILQEIVARLRAQLSNDASNRRK
jgi:hypothetical protein